ncbi:hypothetical protein F5Y19DRAFT_478982 [Xylariaceae sp. FL1651]|nr:hypothetical protein F5Y19DRAFT_478982 [Xylariaceae sp. FL1651]
MITKLSRLLLFRWLASHSSGLWTLGDATAIPYSAIFPTAWVVDGMKRRRVKAHVDYRHRWPTQQTLVDSQISFKRPRSKLRQKFKAVLRRRLKREAPHEPGKSTHPYDTGIIPRGRDSESASSTSSSTTIRDPENGKKWWKLPNRKPRVPSPLPIPQVPLTPQIKEEPRPETPKSPVQLFRFLASPRKSPFPRSRTASPFDLDNDGAKSVKSTPQPPAPPPPKAPQSPVKERIISQAATIESFLRTIFKR